jgi:recombination protein U
VEIHYPGGRKYKGKTFLPSANTTNYGNRGMTLEEDINASNEYYLMNRIAIIHKKPTPIQIVKVEYPRRSKARICEAYFRTPSTTDYNGVYKGRYIDFEAKETKNKTSFPLKNFHPHQIHHMEGVIECGGISFVIVRFSATDELFLLEGKYVIQFWERMENGGRKSIRKEEFIQFGHRIPLGIQPRIDYIRVIDSIWFQ